MTNRRTFLGQLATGAGALSFASTSLAKGSFLEPPAKKLGIALVGLGYYSTYKLAPALLETQYGELRGIVTGTPSKIDKWQKDYNIPDKNVYNYENFDEIADNSDIDVIYIVLPNGMHAEYTIRAAQAGKHVICEKPMANTVSECEEMIQACKDAGKQLAIGYRLHYEPHTREVMRLGQEQVFGPIKMIESGFGFRIGDPTQWRLDKELAGGGPLMDVGVYVIQGARYVTGEEPIAITAQTIKTDPVKFDEVEETALWQMEFPSGAIANCSTTYAANTERLRVNCESGWFELSPAYSYGPIKGRTSQEVFSFPHINHQAAHMDGVCWSILNDEPNIVPGEEGLRDLKVLDAIYRAIDSGRRELV